MSRLKYKLNKLNKLKKKLTSELFKIELVFFIGLSLIITTNFLIHLYFGMYTVGVALIAFSIFQFRFRDRGDKT